MEAIEQSRLLNNLRRDLKSNFKEDETLSILNLSGREIEITDNATGITKIIYPRSVFHTNRPKDNLIFRQFADEEKIIEATLHRSKIRKNFISVETPMKYKDEIGNYAELLSMKWIGRLLKTSDIFIITHTKNYILYNDDVTSDFTTIIVVLLVLISAIALSILLYIVLSDSAFT